MVHSRDDEVVVNREMLVEVEGVSWIIVCRYGCAGGGGFLGWMDGCCSRGVLVKYSRSSMPSVRAESGATYSWAGRRG